MKHLDIFFNIAPLMLGVSILTSVLPATESFLIPIKTQVKANNGNAFSLFSSSISSTDAPIVEDPKTNYPNTLVPHPSSAMRLPVVNVDRRKAKEEWRRLCLPTNIFGSFAPDTDVRFQWDSSDDTNSVAQRVIHTIQNQKGFSEKQNVFELAEKEVAHSIHLFTRFCSSSSLLDVSSSEALRFKGRIVASRGKSGTKCPVWHLDHVPVRLIQSLVGPGSQWVDSRDVQWENVNNLSDDILDPEERNRLLVRPHSSIFQANEGEPVMFLGSRRRGFISGVDDPCVHKSPNGLMPWDERVLLTLDVDM